MDDNRTPERDIERELEDLGSRLEYPPTPDLARTVRQRLDAGDGRPVRRRRAFVPSPRWAAIAAVAVLLVALPVLPATREALSGLFAGGGGAGQAAGGSASQEAGGGAPVGGEDLPESAAPESRTGDAATSAAGFGVFFPKHGGGAVPGGLFEGKLVIDEKGCIRLRMPGGSALTPIWPPDYSVEYGRATGRFRILGGEGRTRAVDGDRVMVRGNLIAGSPEDVPGVSRSTARELRERCPGDYLYAGGLWRATD